MKKLSLLTTILTMVTLSVSAEINQDWLFRRGAAPMEITTEAFNSEGFTTVTIPHSYIPSGSTDIYREQKADMTYEGEAWYRKELTISNELEGKRLFLRFGAVFLNSEIYLNGERIGEHKGGYSAFIFEITDKVKLGQRNILAVHTDNSLNDEVHPLGGGYVKFGGITRPVELIVKEPSCISPLHFASSGVYIKPTAVSEQLAEIVIETKLSTPAKERVELKYSLIDSDGKAVAKASAKGSGSGEWSLESPLKLKNPRLWRGKVDPALYTLRVELYSGGKLMDTIEERTGFRSVSVDIDKGFFLNGESYPLRGVAMHQHFPGVGSAMLEEHFDHDMATLLDLGANAVRLSHYPHSEYRLDLFDENGIVAFSEIPWIKEFYENPTFHANLDQQLQEMVYQLYNHPSIAIWGLFNEIRYDNFKGMDVLPVVERINNMAKEIDPARLTCGVSWQQGERNDIADLSGWNRYQGWYWNSYGGSPADFSWIDQIRREHPNRLLGITEYGGGGAINHFDGNSRRAPYNGDQFHPVDFYNYSHEEHLKQIDQRPWLWGTFIWTLSEFLVPNYDQGRSTFIHDKGLIAEEQDEKKDAYYLYKAAWRKDTPVFHLAYKQFEQRLKPEAEVTIYSNLPEASLLVNGIEMGTLKDANHGIYRWSNIPLQRGENSIVAYTEHDGERLEQSATWYYIDDINDCSQFQPIIENGSEWRTSFKDAIQQSKKSAGSGIPGEEISAKFNLSDEAWQGSEKWEIATMPLLGATKISKGNWSGAMLYLTREFTLTEELKNPYLYLLQSATMSTANEGRITVAIDGVAIFTQEEGSEDYRLIPIGERLGTLQPGVHTIAVIANTPKFNAKLDLGLYQLR